jgi:glycosyltransferase involved in cell wall biosynthesis
MLIGIDASRATRARRTGVERYCLEIIAGLLALPQAAAHTWRLYVDRDATPGDTWPGDLPAHAELRMLPSQRLWTHLALRREVLRRPPDVLFVPGHVIPFVWPATRLPPAVVTVHDLGYLAYPDAHTWAQRAYLTWSTRWSAFAAARIIAISRATADDLVARLGADRTKIAVVHEAPTPLAVPSAECIAATRARYGLARPYALFVGTIHPRKNIARLLAAYAALGQEGGPGFDLALIGAAGWRSGALIAQAAAQERVHLLGYVPAADLPALLAGATFFVFPSLYEGFGLPVLEAQSLGVPVMTSHNSALPEIAGDAALLVDPTDVDAIAHAMLQLSQDETLRRRLIAAGYANVQRYSWTKAAAETLAVLEQAVASKRT